MLNIPNPSLWQIFPSARRQSTNARPGTIWLRDASGTLWEPLSSSSYFELRRDRSIVATDVTVRPRALARLRDAMANEEEVRITLRPHEGFWVGTLRAIFFVEGSGLTTLTIDAVEPGVSFAAKESERAPAAT